MKPFTVTLMVLFIASCTTLTGCGLLGAAPETKLKFGDTEYTNNKNMSVRGKVTLPIDYTLANGVKVPAGTVVEFEVLSDGAVAVQAREQQNKAFNENINTFLKLLDAAKRNTAVATNTSFMKMSISEHQSSQLNLSLIVTYD